jgi:methyl-accepting chemotaxis protein
MAKAKANHKTVMDCVKEYASVHKEFTVTNVCEAYPDRPKNQIATALWKLRNAGVVTKSLDGVYTVVLTGVNAPAPKPSHSAIVKEGMAKTISKLNTQVAEYKKTIDRANDSYEELATRFRVLSRRSRSQSFKSSTITGRTSSIRSRAATVARVCLTSWLVGRGASSVSSARQEVMCLRNSR